MGGGFYAGRAPGVKKSSLSRTQRIKATSDL